MTSRIEHDNSRNTKWQQLWCTGRIETPVDREEFIPTCHFDAEKGDFYLNNCTVKTKSKEEINVLLLSTMPPMLKKMENDSKGKPAICKSTFLKMVPISLVK